MPSPAASAVHCLWSRECGCALSSVDCNRLLHPLQEAGIDAEQAMGLLVSSQPELPPFQGAKQILRWEDKIVSRCTCCSRPALCIKAKHPLRSAMLHLTDRRAASLHWDDSNVWVGAASFLGLPGTQSQILIRAAMEAPLICAHGATRSQSLSPSCQQAPAVLRCDQWARHMAHPRVAAEHEHPPCLPCR